MAHDNLENMLRTDFALIKHHGYTQYDLNHMMPFVRKIHVLLLMQHLREMEEQKKGQQEGSNVLGGHRGEDLSPEDISSIMKSDGWEQVTKNAEE